VDWDRSNFTFARANQVTASDRSQYREKWENQVKLLRVGPPGEERPALLDVHGQLRDVSMIVSEIGGNGLWPESLDKLRRTDAATLPVMEGAIRIGPCVGGVGKIVCVGLNYRDHAAEANMAIPAEPILFLKPTSAIVGANDDVEIPRGAEKVDWEVELGVVIGKPGKYLSRERAFDHVAGYCVVNDVSERAYQLERGGQWDKGKGCDTFAPIGPWLVTADEIGDPQVLDMWLDVDGHRAQTGNTRTMIFGVADLVSYISQFMGLRSGDIIATGTPPGVGMGKQPPRYLQCGQSMSLGISGLGIQKQRMIPAKHV
jgi:2-keto-4-pentenoate hydratase/2-oxohepta-3-ene-1,7-dioic acid hydratase in catechol pathway